MSKRGSGNGRKPDVADLTLEVLGKIHQETAGMRHEMGEMRTGFNQRLDQTNQRLDQTNQRLDQTNQRLERVEQGLLDLGQFMRQIALEMTKYERFHAHHVEVIEKDVQDLKERMRRLEDRPPSGR